MAKIDVVANGPLHCASAVLGDAEAAEVWLCRCGRSANKPFCDGSHNGVFEQSGVRAVGAIAEVANGATTIRPLPNGPLMATGGLQIVGADGVTIFAGAKAALCRCGKSANAPFCDAAHKACGFTAP